MKLTIRLKEPKALPKIGDIRTRKKFLFIPKCKYNFEENTKTYYWLCFVNATYEYCEIFNVDIALGLPVDTQHCHWELKDFEPIKEE